MRGKETGAGQITFFEEEDHFADELLSDGDEAFWYADDKPDHPHGKRTKKRHDSNDGFEVVIRTTPCSHVLRKGADLF